MNRRPLLALGMAAAIAAACADDMTEPSHGASVQIAQGVAVRAAPGDTVRLSASVLDGQGQPVPRAVVRWTSGDPTVATVDVSGLVVGVSAGSTTVTATAPSGASADLIVTVGPIRKVNDRTMLTVLYETTDGPNWVNSNGWTTDAPLGAWHGVDTDDSGRVTSINLINNGLAGDIPPELGNLANLERLDLRGNTLTGEIPPELGNLANLRGLFLHGNDLTGEIPPELGNLANLGWLYLYSNDLTGEIPPELGNLANLQELGLGGNDLTGEVPPELGNLANLQWLWLAGNDLTGEIPVELGNLANLETMVWSDNAGLCAPGTRQFIDFAAGLDSAEGPFCHEADAAVLGVLYELAGGSSWSSSDGWLQPGPLSDWHGVETDTVAGRVVALDLSGNGLSGALPGSLSSLKALRELRVHDNSELGGRLPLGMTALALRALRYDGTGLCTPAEPSFRDWLRSIASHAGTAVECPPLTDRDVLEVLYHVAHGPNWNANDKWLTDAPLGDWHGVETDLSGRVAALNLSRNDLTGEIPLELGNLANLHVLNLIGNGLTGEIPPELGNLDSLRNLNLSWNRNLRSEIPPELGNLTNLEELRLAGNDLTGEIPPELGNLTNLLRLELSWNWNLRSEIPPELDNLANLQQLLLNGNDLTGEIPPELGNLTNLWRLELSWNRNLRSEIPPELGNLTNLWRLKLDVNNLTGEIPPELGNLTNLRGLELNENNLTGEIPPELSNLANLQRLKLNENNLTGEIPPELSNLANLQRLELSNNAGMSGKLRATLTSLEMSALLLGGTGLCAPQDAAFQSWLRSIPIRRVPVCVERTEGEATAAAYVVQAVQSFEFPVPLVAGRPGLLRVFVSAPQSTGAHAPAARARFYQRDGSERVLEVPSGNGTLTAELQEGSLWASANVEVPGDLLRPGVEMVVEVDPSGVLDPELGVPARIPATGRTALEVYELPSFDVTVVPFLWEADPDSSILDVTRGMTPDDSLFEETRRLLPVGGMRVRVHDPVWTSSRGRSPLLRELNVIASMEYEAGYKRYWMGTMAGLGGGVADSRGWMVSAIHPSTIAHEFGHTMVLLHAPCGGTAGLDPAYPSRSGRIGAWGWDRRSGRLVPPKRADLMSYCDPTWVGDYHFTTAFGYRRLFEGSSEGKLGAGVAAFQGPPTRILLLWGGADADGQPFLNPAFVVDDARASVPDGTGEWRIVGEAEDGRALFDRAFEMAEIADGDGRQSFVFALPTEADWADALSRIVLTGPDGEVSMDAQSGPTAALLRDPATGQVRGILRDWPDPATQADAAAALPEPGLEVQVSRGIPAPDAWRR